MTFNSTEYTGLGYGYLYYSHIPEYFTNDEMRIKSTKIKSLFSKLMKKWDAQLNSEWVARTYLAGKLILSTNLLASSLEYSIENNLKTVVPYLSYYSILTACRAYIVILPSEDWNDGDIIAYTHDKIINVTCDSLRTINQQRAEEFRNKIYKLKAIRELFSYKFPSNGMKHIEKEELMELDEILNYCGLLCELAQLNSEFLEASFLKHVKNTSFEMIDEVFWNITQYEDKKSRIFFVDDNDYYRLGQWTRTLEPTNIICAMRQGLVDDFYEFWEDGAESDNSFVPNPRIVFDVP